MLKIRRSHDCLNLNMGIPIPGKDGLYIYWDGAQISVFLDIYSNFRQQQHQVFVIPKIWIVFLIVELQYHKRI